MKNANIPQILTDLAAYYAAKLTEHGPTPRGVDWNGVESHHLRHRQFLRLFERNREASVIDLGCGFGDFLGFLRSVGHQGRFIGYDIEPSMIGQARRLYGETAECRWHVASEPTEIADYAIASGIFNVKGNVPSELWTDHIYRTIDLLAKSGRLGFGFNILSMASDPHRRRPDLFYADPNELLAHCFARYGRSVALLQDYGLYEFTILVRHPNH
jgi:SAM-dependent methyltransferase